MGPIGHMGPIGPFTRLTKATSLRQQACATVTEQIERTQIEVHVRRGSTGLDLTRGSSLRLNANAHERELLAARDGDGRAHGNGIAMRVQHPDLILARPNAVED